MLGDLVRVALSHNDGGIFGLLGASAGLLGLVSIAVIGIIVWLQAHQGRTSPLLTVALGLLLGGALGNLIDRLSRGFVVDWVDMGIGDRRFYTFNVADSAISIAVVILLVLGLFGDRLGRWAGGTPVAAGAWRYRRRDRPATGADGAGRRPMSTLVTVEVPEGAAGSRTDRFMADASGLSRAYVQRLIADGRVTRDGIAVRSREPVVPGAQMRLEVPDAAPIEPGPEPIPLRIVYQDDDLLIVDKPAGLVTHPSPGHATGTLVNALVALDDLDGGGLGTVAGTDRPGIVHRLDRDTSGLLMVARTDAAQASLQAQLKAQARPEALPGPGGGVGGRRAGSHRGAHRA